MWYKQSSVFCRSVSWEELYLRLEPPSRGEAALSLQMFSWLGCIFIDAFDEDDSIYNNFRSSNAFALIFYCFLLGGYFCRYKQCFPRHNIEILELTESALFKKLLAGAPSFQMLRNIHPCVQAFSICWRGGEAAMAGLTKWRPASASALPSTACSAACSASALLLYRCDGALQELCYFY